ncbi:MAG: hypothetical protein ACK56I_03865, partial [bacterium]
GAASCPMGLYQGGSAGPDLLGYRVAGDARHSEDGQHPGPDGHPQLAAEAGGDRRRIPPASSDALPGPAG